MSHHLATGTANSGGAFATSISTDALSRDAHEAMADLVGGKCEEHSGAPGADILAFTGPVLIGMGLMAALMLISQRRSAVASRNK